MRIFKNELGTYTYKGMIGKKVLFGTAKTIQECIDKFFKGSI